MEKLKLWALARIDQAHELMGWAVFCVASTLICLGKISGEVYLGLVLGAAVTVVGIERYRGLKLGPGGVEVGPGGGKDGDA